MTFMNRGVINLIELLWMSLAAGSAVALMTGPLGSFIVWRRMSYFGDSLAHSGLLGVALGFLLNLNPQIGLGAITFALALLLFFMGRKKHLSTDTLLGILSHGALSFGLITISLMDDVRIDLNSLLFGDILSVQLTDLFQIIVIMALVLGIVIFFWNRWLLMTVSEDLARAEGVNTHLLQLFFLLLIALTIAVAMKLVGILLITSMMIIPAATARRLVQNPEQMAVLAAAIGVLSVFAGIFVSVLLDTPSGPTTVATATSLFAIVYLTRALIEK